MADDTERYAAALFPSNYATLAAYAALPGINESGGDELGIQFAETVII